MDFEIKMINVLIFIPFILAFILYRRYKDQINYEIQESLARNEVSSHITENQIHLSQRSALTIPGAGFRRSELTFHNQPEGSETIFSNSGVHQVDPDQPLDLSADISQSRFQSSDVTITNLDFEQSAGQPLNLITNSHGDTEGTQVASTNSALTIEKRHPSVSNQATNEYNSLATPVAIQETEYKSENVLSEAVNATRLAQNLPRRFLHRPIHHAPAIDISKQVADYEAKKAKRKKKK